DLPRKRFDAIFIRAERDADFRQRRGWFGPFTPLAAIVIAPAKRFFAVAEFPAAAWWTPFTAKATAIATRATAVATVPAAATLGLYALVASVFVKTVGLGFPLRPCGLKQVVQIKAEIGNVRHVV